MREVGERLTRLSFWLAEIRKTSMELLAESAALCEASRRLRKFSEEQRTARQRSALPLYYHSV